jgi:HCOMODA/2-hydroxy-3-carboxy-muconic semialdehyde decarboxylase
MCPSTQGRSIEPRAGAPDSAEPFAAPSHVLIEELAVANRILFRQGVLDAFGHVSVRHDKRPDRFLLARNMAPGLVTTADILEFDLIGNAIDAKGRAVYLERFIHGEIYRARPDVMAVVHSHSPAVIPFGLVRRRPLRSVCHMASFIGICTPVFEIREAAGDESDLLISTPALGVAMTKTLGSAPVVLMRGHGATVVGVDLRRAVFRAIYTEVNARLQAQALALGPVTYLSEGEILSATKTIDTQVDRAWNLWRMQVEDALAPQAASSKQTSDIRQGL